MGYLTDATGAVVDDGDHEITFRLYEQSEDGSAVWEATRTETVQPASEFGTATLTQVKAELSEPRSERRHWLGVTMSCECSWMH